MLQNLFRCAFVLLAGFVPISFGAQLPSLDEALSARTDVYGDAAMQQTNGPSYEFFKSLLPPLRYVNADFQAYPIVLSAPNAKHKARLVSNGSGINLRANTIQWHDFGVPVSFRVGIIEGVFGQVPAQLDGPHLAEGYLPIVQLNYKQGEGSYFQETFASTSDTCSSNAVVLTRFTYKISDRAERETRGKVAVRLDTNAVAKAKVDRLLNDKGEVVLWFDSHWKWRPERGTLEALFTRKETNTMATVAVCTVPMPATTPSPLENGGFDTQRKIAAEAWNKMIVGGMRVEVPEPVVNNAWRQLLLQNFSIINGNSLRYSSGNQYDALYETEGSDALVAMMLWGCEADARRLLPPLLDFIREGIKYQQAGTKLQDVARFYWLTRDTDFINSLRPKWEKEIARISDNRGDNGLLPRERYCNDIATPIYSLNSNSKCWRGLRDLGAALDEAGDANNAAKLSQLAATYRQEILAAAEKSMDTTVQPPFVPVALLGEEKAYDPICATKMGSYWNLLINFVIGNEALGVGSKYEDATLHYLQQHGGLFMGMERARPLPSWWVGTEGVNPLYGTRYVLTLLRRDEPEQALVSFYGMLAQGFTPETFCAGEVSALTPLDALGRQLSLPPNTAGNAHLLTILRYLLVQDLDLDDDGKPETLRLAFATPRRWLEDGKTIKVENAPTAFGPVSYTIHSHLPQGEIVGNVALPQRNHPKQTFLRLRLPEGWKVVASHAGAKKINVDENGTVDLTGLEGNQALHFSVQRAGAQ